MTITMELLKLLLSINLLFVTLNDAIDNDTKNNVYADEQFIKPFDNYIHFIPFIEDISTLIKFNMYDIYSTFSPYINEQRAKGNTLFYGNVTSYFHVSNKTNLIRLNVLNLKIDEIRTEVFNLKERKVIKPVMYTYDNKTQTVVITFDHEFLLYHLYHLIINFVGIMINVNNYWKPNSTDTVWLIAAPDLYGTGARPAFPYWDKPDRNYFSISIQHCSDYKIVTNMKISKEIRDEDKTFIMYNTVNISPYLVAIVLHKLDRLNIAITSCFNYKIYDDDMPVKVNIQIWNKDKFSCLDFIRWMTKASIEYLQKNMSKLFPRNIKIIIVPNFRDEGVETQGLILYSEEAVVYDVEYRSVAHKMTLAFTIARKLAYQFFGNMIGQSWGSYLWINEGVASFLGMKIVGKILNNTLKEYFVVQFLQESLHLNDYYDMPLVSKVNESDINLLFPFTRYVKAPIFIRMLSQTIPKVFMSGLNRYVALHQYKFFDTSNSISNKFFNIMQETLESIHKENSMNLERRMNNWITQKRYLVLDVQTIQNTSEVVITLSQNNSNKSFPKDLWIPVTYIRQNHHRSVFKHWLYSQKQILHAHFHQILESLLNRLGYKELNSSSYLIKNLRHEAAKWACVLGLDTCKNNATLALTENCKKYHECEREIKLPVILIDIINYVYSKEQLDKVNFSFLKTLLQICEVTIIMELLKLFLSINLIFITLNDAINNDTKNNVYADEQFIKPFDNYIHFIPFIEDISTLIKFNMYDIYSTFSPYINEQRAKGNTLFYGNLTSYFQVSNKTNLIRLNVLNLKIDETGTEVFTSIDRKVIKPIMYTYDNKTQTVVITFDHEFLPSNIYHLIINFVGIMINANNYWKSNLTDTVWLIAASNLHGTGARPAFPYCDRPDIRTNFSISIQHCSDYKIVTNTKVSEKTGDEDKTFIKYTSVNISPYLVAIVLHKFGRITDACSTYKFNDNDMPVKVNIQIWSEDDLWLDFFQWMIKASIEYLQKNISKTLFPRNMKIIVVPNFQDKDVEARGLILYSEAAVLYDVDLFSGAQQMTVAFTVARKLVYQFFGNMIGQSWESYLWINEGVATFLGMKIVDEILNYTMLNLFVVQFQHESLHLNDYYDMPLVSKVNELSGINSLFPFIRYIKAPVFIRMLSQTIPKDVFMSGLSRYVALHQDKSFDTSNSISNKFFNIMQETLKNIYKRKSMDLGRRMNNWIIQKRYLVLNVQTIQNTSKVIITLSQNNSDKSFPKGLWIHVTYTRQNYHYYNNLNIVFKHWLHRHNPILRVANTTKDEWIIANVAQAGYYRVKYDDRLWENILKCLLSSEYSKIHVLNRAQLIDDAYHFLLKGKLNFDLFKKLTSYLSKEENYISWYPVFKIMEQISGFFPFSKSSEIKTHFHQILESLLNHLGYNESPDENNLIKSLRHEAAKWACVLGSDICKNNATLRLIKVRQEYQEFPTIVGTDPWWSDWTYCEGTKKANNTIWGKVFLLAKFNKNHLVSLACTEDIQIIFNYINQSENFTKEDRITVLHSIIAKHAKNNLVLDYILQNSKVIS
ncbi:hypothetical protein P5V15_001624, partial [Pogonomyrmex californicus]